MIRLVYYDNVFVGFFTDDDCFWYLYEWLCDSDGVCNVISVDEDQLNFSNDIKDFNKMVAQFGSVELGCAELSVSVNYDDTLD